MENLIEPLNSLLNSDENTYILVTDIFNRNLQKLQIKHKNIIQVGMLSRTVTMFAAGMSFEGLNPIILCEGQYFIPDVINQLNEINRSKVPIIIIGVPCDIKDNIHKELLKTITFKYDTANKDNIIEKVSKYRETKQSVYIDFE